ncbi:MAG: DUF1735 and LamG domain-containing protein [Alistipes sp.]
MLLLAAAGFGSCKGDQESKIHFDNKVFISGRSFVDDIFIKRDNLETTSESQCDITVAVAQPLPGDLNVTFVEAPELLDHYRMFYEDMSAQLLPAGGYYEPLASTTIAAGLVESEPLTFTFKNLDKLPIEEKQRYVLPMRIAAADGLEVLESASTVYFVFSKASLINVVADMQNNLAYPEWTEETEAVKDMESFTLEALIYANSFDRNISTIMGIEDVFMLRFGDDGRPTNQLQVAFAKKVSEEATAPARGKIPADADNRFNLTPFAWHHIAVSFDKGTVSVYIDGKLKETAKAAVSGPDGAPVTIENVNFAIPHSDETEGKPRCFWIGHSYRLATDGELFYERRFDGMMSEVRIWNKALTAEEIGSENHFYKIDPASEGLVAYWKFDDRVPGKNIRDYGPYGFDLKTESDVNWVNVALPME